MNPSVSIVVPVYNVEKYLPTTLESIQRQTFKNWECIVVNDGSTDNSGEICARFGAKDKRFKILNTPNGGVSTARNKALEVATGEYVAFVDSDDWVEDNFLETLYHTALKHEADVVQCGFVKEYVAFSHPKRPVKETVVYQDLEAFLMFVRERVITGHMWNKLIHKNLITSSFPIGELYEDMHVLTDWLQNSRKAVVIPDILYHYRMRKSSYLHKVKPSDLLVLARTSIRRVETAHEETPELFRYDELAIARMKSAVKGAKEMARSHSRKEDRLKNIGHVREILKSEELPDLKSSGFKLFYRSRLLLKSPSLFSTVMRMVSTLDFHSKYREKNLFQ